MEQLTFFVEQDPNGGYNTRAMGRAIFVQGDTVAQLKCMGEDAIYGHFGLRHQSFTLNFL